MMNHFGIHSRELDKRAGEWKRLLACEREKGVKIIVNGIICKRMSSRTHEPSEVSE